MGIRVASLAIVFLLFARSSFGSIGFQETTIPDPQGKEIAVGVWYFRKMECSFADVI